MAYTHKLTPNSPDSHQMNAWWLGVVVRFKVRDSWNRSFNVPDSKREVVSNPVDENPNMLIVDNDIISWSTSSSKSSHVSNLQWVMLHSDTDYTVEVAPDDWVLFWAFDNKKDYLSVKERLKRKERCNDFNDGLKFVGRVDGIRKQIQRDPNSGNVSFTYLFTACGYSEFDSTVYYNPLITKTYPNAFMFMPDFGVMLEKFVSDSGLTPPQTIIPAVLGVCLGVGPGENSKGFAPSALEGEGVSEDIKSLANNPGLSASPNRAYRVPDTVAALLGVLSPQRSIGFTYLDILKQVIGIQEYDSSGFMPKLHAPSDGSDGSVYNCRDLDGEALKFTPNFNKTTVWSLIGTYLNSPINEMYTCLRVGPDKSIMPTFVARQLPLSSQEFISAGKTGTAFLDLPRWDIPNTIIHQLDVGRSNVQRFNYIFVHGTNAIGSGIVPQTIESYERVPPIVDRGDIFRAGLRMHDCQVSGNITDTHYTDADHPGRRWGLMMADILFNGHLKYTGTVTMEGVQAPICEGDNAVVDGVVYHIERVQHSGSLDIIGRRSFSTSLFLTNGVSILSDKVGRQVYPDLRHTTAPLEATISGETDWQADPKILFDPASYDTYNTLGDAPSLLKLKRPEKFTATVNLADGAEVQDDAATDPTIKVTSENE